MALQGSLGHLGLADLLQTGLAGQAAGLLTMRNGAGRAALYVGAEGLTLIEPDVLDAEDLVEAFVARGFVSGDEVERLRGDGLGGLPLVDALVAHGLLPEAELTDVLAGWAEDTILDLLTWDQGEFRFVEGPHESGRAGLVSRTSVDAGAVLLRAAQRLDERSEIARTLGFHASLIVGLPGIVPVSAHTGDPSPRMHPLLDGQRTIDEVALIVGIGRFAALKSAHQLVQAGSARVPVPEEVEAAVDERLDRHEYRAARALVLQWIETGSSLPAAYERLAQIAHACARIDEEIDALRSLAQLRIASGSSAAALGTLRTALLRYPHHPVLLAALRDASEAAGDIESFVDSTLRMAENALHDGEGERASALLEPLTRAQPDALGVRTLHAKALERCGRIDELVAVVQDVARRIGRRCRTREDRDAARTLADIAERAAPERTELVRRLRNALERGDHQPKRLALAVALLAIVAAAGIVLWPPSASSMLSQAQAALDGGRRSEAQELLDELIERYPDSAEAESAFQLQARLTRPSGPAPRAEPALNAAERAAVEAGEETARMALGRLPAAEAREILEAYATRLDVPEIAPLRPGIMKGLRRHLARAIHDLGREARRRAEVLARATTVAAAQANDAKALGAYLDSAKAAAEPTWTEGLVEALPVLERFVHFEGTTSVRQLNEELAQDTRRLAGAWAANEAGLDACRRAVLRLEIEVAHRKASQDGPRELAFGRLENAEALYRDLDRLILEARSDKRYGELIADLERHRVPQWLDAKLELIATIGQRVREARAAEAEGRLHAASKGYAALLRTYDTYKLEALAPMPLQVMSDPSGATIELNGKKMGETPAVIRYPWGGQVTVRIVAPGYVPVEHVVRSSGDDPEWQLDFKLAPQAIWAVLGDRNIDGAPLGVNGHVLTASRGGRVTLYDRETGAIRWSREFNSLEGVRQRPVLATGRLHVFLVDGTLHMLDPRDGAPMGKLSLARPSGDPDVMGDTVAIATRQGQLVLLRHGAVVREIDIQGTASTNVVNAHGAFWVGLADGRIARVNPESGRVDMERVGERGASLRFIVGTTSGIIATTAAGDVALVGADGRRRWIRGGMGDLQGRPAVALGRVAVTERKGRLLLLELADGSPAGGFEMDAPAPDGLLAAEDVFIAALSDGRLLAIEPEGPRVRVDAQLGGRTPLPPALIGADHIVVALDGDRIGLVPVPRRPAAE